MKMLKLDKRADLKRHLFLCHPIVISAKNVEKWRFYMPFFSLNRRRISASYKHTYENAEIRQK